MTSDYRQRLEEFAISQVPEHLHEGILLYIEQGVVPGGFLCAVLQNDLREAFARADVQSAAGLQALVSFLHADAPSPCWGSKARFETWISHAGLNVKRIAF